MSGIASWRMSCELDARLADYRLIRITSFVNEVIRMKFFKVEGKRLLTVCRGVVIT